MLGTMVTDGLLDLGLGDPAALPILLDFRTQSVEPTLRLEFEQGAPHGIHLLLGQTVDLLVQERAQIFRIDIGKCAHGAKIATGRVLFQTIPPTRLKSLAHSANARNARMGRWYLRSLEEAAEPSLFVAWECARAPAAAAIASTDLVLYVNPELQRLRALVDAARARLAEREAGFTIEKAKVEAMKARLFARLRERWMASLRRAMRTTPQAHLLEGRFARGVGMARGATPSTGRARRTSRNMRRRR